MLKLGLTEGNSRNRIFDKNKKVFALAEWFFSHDVEAGICQSAGRPARRRRERPKKDSPYERL
jgi:hypothetical protein